MILYRFVKNLTALAVLVFNRKVFFINRHLIPESGAIIFAINHPTAFSDSFMFMVFSRIDCYFILRGDFFKVSKFVLWFMNAIRLIPIYRARDGFSALRQNQALFESFYQIIHEKKSISIMVEGSHDYRKRLRPVQRGTAKIVFGTYETYGDTDMIIVPMGLTYSDIGSLRGTVSIKVEAPIPVKDYLAQYQANARQAENTLTAEIEQRIRKCLVHVAQPDDDELVDQLLLLHRNDAQLSRFPCFSEDGSFLEREMEIAETVNRMERSKKETLQHQLHHYFSTLKSHKILDEGIAGREKKQGLKALFLLISLPFFIVGYLTCAPIASLANRFTRKRIKKKEFIYSVGMVVHMFGFLIYFLILLFIALLSMNIWWIGLVLVLPLLGYFALLWREYFLDWKAIVRFKRLNPTLQQELNAARAAITWWTISSTPKSH